MKDPVKVIPPSGDGGTGPHDSERGASCGSHMKVGACRGRLCKKKKGQR